MNIEVRQNLKMELYGFSGPVKNNEYGATGFKLMDAMWAIVKGKNLKNSGINVWVYDSQAYMFAGVALDPKPTELYGLELKKLEFKKYAYYKHVGSYDLLRKANVDMREEMQSKGWLYGAPSLEIYGHHHPDASKLETELIYTLL